MAGKGEVVAAVDFGSHAIRVLIGRRFPDGMTKILGYGSAPSHECVSFGAIQDADGAAHAFKSALKDAKRMANDALPISRAIPFVPVCARGRCRLKTRS